MQYRIFALLTALYLLILFLISMAWEFSLVDRVAALWFSGHLPETAAERWDSVVTGISIAIVAWIVPGALMLRNIMERKRVESTQERLVSILQVTPDPVKISRRDGRTIFLNRAARRIMGISDDQDVSDLHYLDAHTPEARKTVEEVAIPTALAEGTWMGESELLTPSGGRMPVSEVIIAHKDRKGAVEYLSTISRDITAQKEIEILKSDFVSIVSHELRTPLTSIRNSLNLVMDEMGLELPEDAMEMLHIAQANTNRLARLINDILDLEKVEYKRLELFPVQLDARELIATTLSELEPVASQAQVALKHKVDDGIVLEGDRDRLVQVITNLVGNAINFSEAGQFVEVSARPLDNGHVRFAVADHGPGIPEEHRAKLFHKFEQVPIAERSVKRGTGLGLAISKVIVEQHGGEIGVETEVGKGSVFYFDLPPKPPSTPDETA